ncbi:MAG TPA: hypothetical protein VI911_08710 [Patescibacteria group bacterium]|nr:MAG: hypothetical protein UR43_C0005G0090 [candidate division TM6 bacterium GW2011_GWF2_33_332]HLD91077.1 hypothetical protein [Patescibacteria group bacterium]
MNFNHYLMVFNYLDIFEKCFCIFIILLCVGILSVISYNIYWHLNYKYEYSDAKETTGIVTDMNYRASYMITVFNGKTINTIHHPEKNEVYIYIESLNLKKEFDSSKLYQLVRIDDTIKITYKECYIVKKDYSKKKTLDSYEILTITTPKGRIWEN